MCKTVFFSRKYQREELIHTKDFRRQKLKKSKLTNSDQCLTIKLIWIEHIISELINIKP